MIDILVEVGKTLIIGAFFGTLVGLYLVINKKLENRKINKENKKNKEKI